MLHQQQPFSTLVAPASFVSLTYAIARRICTVILFTPFNMPDIVYREATETDIPKMALIRAAYSGTVEYWTDRITNYYRGYLNPQKALPPRIMYVASLDAEIIAFVVGHLSTRYNCEGELQWIDTIESYRGRGVATSLFKMLGKWFIAHNAYKICVDPGNSIARKFYQNNGATNLNDHWMFWDDIRVTI